MNLLHASRTTLLVSFLPLFPFHPSFLPCPSSTISICVRPCGTCQYYVLLLLHLISSLFPVDSAGNEGFRVWMVEIDRVPRPFPGKKKASRFLLPPLSSMPSSLNLRLWNRLARRPRLPRTSNLTTARATSSSFLPRNSDASAVIGISRDLMIQSHFRHDLAILSLLLFSFCFSTL